MRVAERDFAIRVLGYETVDAPTIVFRQLARDAGLQDRQRVAYSEGGIETQRQARSERWAKFPAVGLRPGAHHLQLAAGDTAVAKVCGIKGLKIVPAADDGLFGMPCAGTGFDKWQADGVNRG